MTAEVIISTDQFNKEHQSPQCRIIQKPIILNSDRIDPTDGNYFPQIIDG